MSTRIGRIFRFFFVGLIFFVVVAGLFSVGLAYRYKDAYYPGIQIAGLNLTGKTQDQAKQLLAIRIAQYLHDPIKIVIPDISKPVAGSPNQYQNSEIATTAEKVGLQVTGEAALKQAWLVGHQPRGKNWLKEVLPAIFKGYQPTLTYQIDQKAVRDFIDTAVVPKIGAPVPALVVVQNGQVVVEPPQPGFMVNQDELARDLIQSLQEVSDNDTAYIKAPVTSQDSPITEEEVQPIAQQWDQLGSLKVTIQAGSLALKPSRQDLLSWFAPVQDEKGALTLAIQKEVIDQYLSKQNQLDQAKSLQNVMDKLTPLLSSTTLPSGLSVAASLKPLPKTEVATLSNTPGKFPGKYVEVNLADQRMYLFNGSSLEKTYVVSTGKASTPTPVGIFHIHGKSLRAYSYLYGLYMPYWENFLNGEYGIHQLPEWPNGYREGESHLGIPVSDGCIRLGVGAAEYVYNWTEDGTPVYVH